MALLLFILVFLIGGMIALWKLEIFKTEKEIVKEKFPKMGWDEKIIFALTIAGIALMILAAVI